MEGRRKIMITLAILFLPFFACQGESGDEKDHQEMSMGEMGEQHESMHGEEGDMMEDSGHHADAHMHHMAEVKEWLKEELGEAYDEQVPAASPRQIELGKQVYMRSCTSCHGEDGKGDGPAAGGLSTKPSDFTDPDHANYYSDRGRLHIIRNGVPDSPMAPWKNALSDDEIMAVFGYVRSLTDQGGSREGPEHGDHRH
jgi:mono/diheme cytochrome c family protein